jgi:hypothetical protein
MKSSAIESEVHTSEAAVIWLCDLNPKSLKRVRNTCRVVGVSNDPADILNAPPTEAIAIVVPASHVFHL